MPIEMDELEVRTLQDGAQDRRSRFYGKYRGVVVEALTGDDLGKLSVSVPSVLADVTCVAWPCVPFAGPGHGFVALPEVDDGVWIEFEAGNPAQAIWVGCWWGNGDMPKPSGPTTRSWVTSKGLALVLDDDGGQISLQYGSGPSIVLTEDSIVLSTQGSSITLDAQGITLKGMTQVSL